MVKYCFNCNYYFIDKCECCNLSAYYKYYYNDWLYDFKYGSSLDSYYITNGTPINGNSIYVTNGTPINVTYTNNLSVNKPKEDSNSDSEDEEKDKLDKEKDLNSDKEKDPDNQKVTITDCNEEDSDLEEEFEIVNE